jgi:hypothetical protein
VGPGTWNRYAYTQGDPVNFAHPTGELAKGVGGPCGTEGGQTDCDASDGAGAGGNIYWDPTGGGAACTSVTIDGLMFGFVPIPNAGCYAPASSAVNVVAVEPTCAEVLGAPSGTEATQLAVLMGEDSWGLGYGRQAVGHEELYMLQVVYNYATAGGAAGTSAGISATVNTDTYRGYLQGVINLSNALNSPYDSSACEHLAVAEASYDEFWGGLHSLSNVNQWRSASAAPSEIPGEFQTAGTVFWYEPGAAYSPTRPYRRKTPSPLPRPRRRRRG